MCVVYQRNPEWNGADAVAFFQRASGIRRRGDGNGAEEEPVEVLFAGQIGAPRRKSHRAVVDGSETQFARRVFRGLQALVSRRRPSDPDRRLSRDATGIPRVAHDLPLAVLVGPSPPSPVVIAILAALDFDDRHAVCVERLLGLFCRPRRNPVGKQEALVGVLVVLRQQAMARTVNRKVDHAVVVHSPLLRLILGAVARVRLELGSVGDRVAPGDQHVRGVALRHADRVGGRNGNTFEPEQPPVRPAAVGRHGNGLQQRSYATGGRSRGGRQTPFEKTAPGQPGLNDFLKALVVGFVHTAIFLIQFGHGCSCRCGVTEISGRRRGYQRVITEPRRRGNDTVKIGVGFRPYTASGPSGKRASTRHVKDLTHRHGQWPSSVQGSQVVGLARLQILQERQAATFGRGTLRSTTRTPTREAADGQATPRSARRSPQRDPVHASRTFQASQTCSPCSYDATSCVRFTRGSVHRRVQHDIRL